MTARTLTLSDFLLARIAEDEERARFVAAQIEGNNWASFESWALSWHDEYDLLCIEPSRVLAECEAKRRIVEEWVAAQQFYTENVTAPAGELAGLTTALRAIASIFVDHPDYDPDWRP